MHLVSRILRSNFIIKLRSWEYWPFHVLHAPLYFYWIWLSIKARSIVFFSASNPGILMGGMFGESKFDTLKQLPDTCRPTTIRVEVPVLTKKVLEAMAEGGLPFPVICKPDLGERGWMVKKIQNEKDLSAYLQKIQIPFLVQAFVDLPLEYGVSYIRYPSDERGHVTSIVGKEMLSVTGNGVNSLRELILAQDRSKLQWELLEQRFADRLVEIIPRDKRIELNAIGNHCLGTKFLNENHLITAQLSASFDAISKHVDGFYFGRFDVRASSIANLEQGNVMVMELNGCGAEPSHIYHPGFSLFKAMGVLFTHWADIYRVSVENHERGAEYLPYREAWSIYRNFSKLTSTD